MKETSVLVAGSGGQGVLLLGRLIAYSGMIENRQVTWFPSYGAEMRGGTANCTVITSDELIGSPVVTNPDILIAMNEASLKRFQSKLKRGGMLFFDSSLVRNAELRYDICAVSIPASEIAASIHTSASSEKGSTPSAPRVRSANMVMLGALVAETGLFTEENAISALEKLTAQKKGKALDMNKEAIRRGIRYSADKKSKD